MQALLELPDDMGLPESRELVPEMAQIARRHPRLNLLDVEAMAAARLLAADVRLSPPASRGILPEALAAEDIAWATIDLTP